jgi:hypothetical protein
VQVVLAPVAMFVTVNTVPNGRVGLAHRPEGAAEYHVAWPCSASPVAVVVGALRTATGGGTVVLTGVDACRTAGATVDAVTVDGVTVDGVTPGAAGGAVVVVVTVGGVATFASAAW